MEFGNKRNKPVIQGNALIGRGLAPGFWGIALKKNIFLGAPLVQDVTAEDDECHGTRYVQTGEIVNNPHFQTFIQAICIPQDGVVYEISVRQVKLTENVFRKISRIVAGGRKFKPVSK